MNRPILFLFLSTTVATTIACQDRQASLGLGIVDDHDAAPEPSGSTQPDAKVDPGPPTPPPQAACPFLAPASCDNVAACGHACFPNTHNPIDDKGCDHSCECAPDCTASECGPEPAKRLVCPDGSGSSDGYCRRSTDGQCRWTFDCGTGHLVCAPGTVVNATVGLDDPCGDNKITARGTLATIKPEDHRTFSYAGGNPAATGLTLRVAHRDGAITCYPEACPGGAVGAACRQAFLGIEAEVQFATADGAFAETFVTELRGYGSTGADFGVSIPPEKLRGTYRPTDKDVTVEISGHVGSSDVNGSIWRAPIPTPISCPTGATTARPAGAAAGPGAAGPTTGTSTSADGGVGMVCMGTVRPNLPVGSWK